MLTSVVGPVLASKLLLGFIDGGPGFKDVPTGEGAADAPPLGIEDVLVLLLGVIEGFPGLFNVPFDEGAVDSIVEGALTCAADGDELGTVDASATGNREG